MTCTAVAAADWQYFAFMVALIPFFVGWAGWFIASGVCGIACSVRERLRARRAAVPFAERARSLEARRERAVALWSRIAERNRREALRRGQGVE